MIRNLARSFGAAFALILVGALAVLVANQSNTWSPTTGTVSGLQITTNYNNAFSAIQSCNSGNSAPVNDQTAAAVKGQCWLSTASSPNPVQMYDGASWLTLGWLDTVNHLWIDNNGGGTATIASATTTDLCASLTGVQAISGTVTITSFGSTCLSGTYKYLSFNGILTLTNSGSLQLPVVGNIVTAAGDTAVAVSLGGSTWRVYNYQRASGASLSATANFTSNVNFNSTISPATLSSQQNNWAPAGLATSNFIRFFCTGVQKVTGLSAPATDGQIVVLANVGGVGGANCVLTANDAASTAPNRFLFDRPIFVRTGRTITLKYSVTDNGWMLWQENTAQPLNGGFRNLRILNVTNALGDTAPATPNNQNKIILDEITLEDINGGAVRIDTSYAFSCTVDITGSTFNASTGGIDTGAVAASTWYFHWVIYNPTTDTPSCLDSISSTTPTMPAGFTFKARVGANQTDASANKCFYRVQQYGRVAHYVATGANAGCSANNSLGAQIFLNATTGTVSNGSPTLVAKQVTGNTFPAPVTASRVVLFINVIFGGGAGSAQCAPSQAYSGTNNGPAGTNGINGHVSQPNTPLWMTLESNSISCASAGGTGAAEAISDWEDNL